MFDTSLYAPDQPFQCRLNHVQYLFLFERNVRARGCLRGSLPADVKEKLSDLHDVQGAYLLCAGTGPVFFLCQFHGVVHLGLVQTFHERIDEAVHPGFNSPCECKISRGENIDPGPISPQIETSEGALSITEHACLQEILKGKGIYGYTGQGEINAGEEVLQLSNLLLWGGIDQNGGFGEAVLHSVPEDGKVHDILFLVKGGLFLKGPVDRIPHLFFGDPRDADGTYLYSR